MARFDFEKYQPHCDWAEFVIDDAKTIGALIGFDIDQVYFSGFSSQGDGACFTGHVCYRKGAAKAVRDYAPNDIELHRIAGAWANLQKSQFYSISGTVKHSGRYSHSGCAAFDFEDSRHHYGHTAENFDGCDFEQVCRDFMDWIYKRLECEWEYQSAWELARAWNDAGERMIEARKEARELVKAVRDERRKGNAAAPVICGALRAQIRRLLDEWSEHRRERDGIAANFYYWCDGSAVTLEQFAADNL